MGLALAHSLLAKCAAMNLAGRPLRQFREEPYHLGNLVGSDLPPDEILQLGCGDRIRAGQGHKGPYDFAESRIGNSDHATLAHRWVLIEGFLHLQRGDVAAGPDDDSFFRPTNQ